MANNKRNPAGPIIEAIRRLNKDIGVVDSLHGNVFEPAFQDISRVGNGWNYFRVEAERLLGLTEVYDKLSLTNPEVEFLELDDNNNVDLSSIPDSQGRDILFFFATAEVQRPSYVTINVSVKNADIIVLNDRDKIAEGTEEVEKKVLLEGSNNRFEIIIRRRKIGTQSQYFQGSIGLTDSTPLKLRPPTPPVVEWEDEDEIIYGSLQNFDTPGLILSWKDSPFAGGWIIDRINYQKLGNIKSYTVSGTSGYTFVVSGSHNNISSGIAVADSDFVGHIKGYTVSSGSNETSVNVRTIADENTSWASSGSFFWTYQNTSTIAEVTRKNVVDEGSTIRYLDGDVKGGKPYSYKIASWSVANKNIVSDYNSLRTQKDLTTGQYAPPIISEDVGRNSYDLSIIDSQLRITAIEYKKKTTADDYEQNWHSGPDWDRSSGTIGSDSILERGEDIQLAEKHNVGIKVRIKYTDSEGLTKEIIKSVLFDIDKIAEISSMNVAVEDDTGDVIVDIVGDDDLEKAYITVAENTDPADPDGTNQDATLNTRSGTVNTGVSISRGSLAYVKVRGENDDTQLASADFIVAGKAARANTSNEPVVSLDSEDDGSNVTFTLLVFDASLSVTNLEFVTKTGGGDSFGTSWLTSWDNSGISTPGTIGTDNELKRNEVLSLNEKHAVGFKIRVSYNDASGNPQTVTRQLWHDINDIPNIKIIPYIDDSGNVSASIQGDDDTASAKIYARKDGTFPTETQVRGASAENGRYITDDQIGTLISLDEGETAKIAAFGYSQTGGSGTESSELVKASITRPTTGTGPVSGNNVSIESAFWIPADGSGNLGDWFLWTYLAVGSSVQSIRVRLLTPAGVAEERYDFNISSSDTHTILDVALDETAANTAGSTSYKVLPDGTGSYEVRITPYDATGGEQGAGNAGPQVSRELQEAGLNERTGTEWEDDSGNNVSISKNRLSATSGLEISKDATSSEGDLGVRPRDFVIISSGTPTTPDRGEGTIWIKE